MEKKEIQKTEIDWESAFYHFNCAYDTLDLIGEVTQSEVTLGTHGAEVGLRTIEDIAKHGKQSLKDFLNELKLSFPVIADMPNVKAIIMDEQTEYKVG